MEDTIIKAAIRGMATKYSEAQKKKVERIEMFFDYKKQNLSIYVKCENDNTKYKDEEINISKSNEAVAFKGIFISDFEKKIEKLKNTSYANVVFNCEDGKEGLKYLELYYKDVNDIDRYFDSRKTDAENFNY